MGKRFGVSKDGNKIWLEKRQAHLKFIKKGSREINWCPGHVASSKPYKKIKFSEEEDSPS